MLIDKIKLIQENWKSALETRKLPRKKSALRQVHLVQPSKLRIKNFPMQTDFWKFYAGHGYFGQFGDIKVEQLLQSRKNMHFSDLIINFKHPLSASLAFLVITSVSE